MKEYRYLSEKRRVHGTMLILKYCDFNSEKGHLEGTSKIVSKIRYNGKNEL